MPRPELWSSQIEFHNSSKSVCGRSLQWNRKPGSPQKSAACLNLENGEQAVILHGRVTRVITDHALAVRFAETSKEKYGFDQSPDLYEGEEMLLFESSVAFAWKLLYEDATRWRFQPEA